MTAKLLLVEDDRVERALMIEAIKGVSDADVVVMGDGRQALEYLRKNGPDSPDAPAVVFLDLSMPVVDGLGVLREFQRQANADRVPVVIFTASDAEADRDLGYEFGANALRDEADDARQAAGGRPGRGGVLAAQQRAAARALKARHAAGVAPASGGQRADEGGLRAAGRSGTDRAKPKEKASVPAGISLPRLQPYPCRNVHSTPPVPRYGCLPEFVAGCDPQP